MKTSRDKALRPGEFCVRKHATDTALVHVGRDAGRYQGLVNVPVCRGSTMLAPSIAHWEDRKNNPDPAGSYGRFGTATTWAVQDAVAALEGGEHALVFPSGLAACTQALLAPLASGDHVLMTDSVYGPVRQFATQVLARMGIDVTFYDPLMGGAIRELITPRTRVVYVESPGSLTFEVQDIPAIAEVAHAAGALVVMDNTWATPLFYKPFAHGVDISIQAATKYIVGHSDALLGVVTANKEAWPLLHQSARAFGQTAGPDDLYLAMRGLRSLGARMRQHQESARYVVEQLVGHPAVRRVLYPAFPGDPGHKIWRRDFTGASGLFGVELHPWSAEQQATFYGNLQLFGLGLSWGGFESLVMPVDEPVRSVRPSGAKGPLIRLHVGLEDKQDLASDLLESLLAAFMH